MKLTRAASYALHAVAYMAAQKSDRPVASHHIARERGIPERFLLKVLKPLVSVGILTSVKGPNGGYRLAKPASEISVLQIIEAADDRRIRAEVPTTGKGNGTVNNKLESLCKLTADAVRKQLERVHVSELVSKK